MKIWVDADACPVVIKSILFRAAERSGLQLTLVSNQPLRVPRAHNIQFIQVASGPDAADREIVERLCAGDLVITNDIPLAAEVIEKKGCALSSRGELYSVDDIKARLSIRNFMESLRMSGVETGGPPALGAGDRKAFADHLDRIITHYGKGK